jgi:hypothetical protein
MATGRNVNKRAVWTRTELDSSSVHKIFAGCRRTPYVEEDQVVIRDNVDNLSPETAPANDICAGMAPKALLVKNDLPL